MRRMTILAAAIPLVLASCYSITHDYPGEREMTPGTKVSGGGESLGKVTGRKKAHFLFWGLLPIREASGPEVLEASATRSHGQGFDAVSHIEIQEEQQALDVVVTILTLGIFSMVTVETSGEVHRSSNGGQR